METSHENRQHSQNMQSGSCELLQNAVVTFVKVTIKTTVIGKL